MKASDVTETLTMALQTSGLDSANVVHRPRLLSDNGSSYIAGDLADWLEAQNMTHIRGAPNHPQTQGKSLSAFACKRLPGSGAVAPDVEEPHPSGELFSAGRS